MPGYITHNIFGREEFKKMKSEDVRSAIRNNRNAFNIGLQGPDIFFYFPASFMINKKNLGSIMHTRRTGEYINKMLVYINGLDEEKDREIALAYFVGFLGHYSLDRTCHPYIYWKTDRMHKTKDYHAKHVTLETDIDYIMCKKFYKREVSKFPYGELVRLNRNELDVIAGLLSQALNNTFNYIRFNYELAYAALFNFGVVINQIKDKCGNKTRFIGKTERKLMGFEYFTPLFIRDDYRIKNDDPLNNNKCEWFNPWKEEIVSDDSFTELMEKASNRYQRLINSLGNPTEFAKELGNKSFLNGLELDSDYNKSL